MGTLFNYFALSDIPGHMSYIIFAVSYCLTSMLWLRISAIIGIILEVAYFAMTSDMLYAGIAWSGIFITINLYHLASLIRDRLSLKLEKDERQLLTTAFMGLCDAQIARMLRAGSWRQLATGSRLVAEGQAVDELYFILSGRLAVYAKDVHVAELGPGALVGEIAFLTGSPAIATVVAVCDARLVAFNRSQLSLECRQDERISAAVHRLIGHDLATKIMCSDLWWTAQRRSERAA